MKKHISDFLLRGLVASGFGPVGLAILYLILHHNGVIQTIDAAEVCTGILSLYILAFVAGGMNAIYQIERLPLMISILIHGVVLYAVYLCTYLIHDWLELGTIPLLVFTCIFVVGYIAVWVIIYSVTRKNTKRLNDKLREIRLSK